MRIQKTFTIFILFLSLNCLAQNTISKDKTLPMVAYWHIGAMRNVNISKQIINKFKDNNDTIKNSYTAKWKIADSTAKNYTIHFTVSQFNFSNLNDSFNQLLNEILPSLTFKYQTNELGVFEFLINKDEVNKTLLEARNNIGPFISTFNSKVNKTVKSYEFLNMIMQLLLDYEILQDIKKIHHFYGLQYKKNTAYTYDTTLIDPSSLRNFKAKSIYKLTNTYPSMDRVKFTCLVKSYEELKGNNRKMWKEHKNSNLSAPKKREKCLY